MWFKCVDGSILFIRSLIENLFGDKGLFRTEYFTNYLPFYLMLVKILIDVGWHHQPYEEFAETVAKTVGFVYSDSRRRMLFENLRIKTLDAMWLPGILITTNL